ncbi:MAG: site-specific DNA-methyltransferase [Bacteroidaceae bacterium]|nr:site-specific DNA-methyltransferase [Bacteroidaceae bacterium]
MKKLKLQTTNIVDENIKRIGELFPNCLTERLNDEGKPEVAIDFDQLRQELSKDIVEGPEERYQFTWPDKRNAIRLANAPTTDTLRPCREESVDFDNTQNLYIEGDNLQVLKLLRENYLGKVKMIYIDPPYNTGNDFVYNDDFSQSTGEYMHNSGQEDEEGNHLVANTESNGRFHTDWLNMIYPRLKVAKDLLSEDGLLFISLNDIEVANARKVCEEVLGANNFVADLIWANKEGGGSSDSRLFRIKNEHILCFTRNIESVEIKGVPISNADRYKGKDDFFEERGPYYLQKLGMGSIQYSASLDYPIEAPDGTTVMPADNNKGEKACWRWSKDKFLNNLSRGFVEMKKDSSGIWTIYTKQYMMCDNDGNIIKRTQRPMGIIEEYSSTQAAKLLKAINIPFDYSKPVELINYLVNRIDCKDSIILDFFSGSATTAHAVMQLNAEDGGKRKFIMVQLPEATDEKSEAYKAGYKNICEIGKERIRRAGKKIKEESPLTTQDLDTGFRVLKLDSSNMQDVYYTPAEFNEQKLFDDNIKPDRFGNDGEDLLFQTMIELGIELSAKIEKRSIAGKAVWSVSDGYLMACFDEDVNETTITEIARQQPYYFVMRDSSLANDQVADNFEQIWEEYSKDTVRRII